jgi:hypothetical protein
MLKDGIAQLISLLLLLTSVFLCCLRQLVTQNRFAQAIYFLSCIFEVPASNLRWDLILLDFS